MGQIGALDGTCREIRWHLERAERRELEHRQIQQLVRATDAIVDELERLNLQHVERLEGEWKRRLTLLFAALPFPYTPWLRAHPSPSEVLDVLFDVQGRLLDLKRQRAARAPAG
ncbi:MAG TPA: hypothetical protein VLW53_16090 [Candidatus Eisenbacteria bacterium]|nr:hypothetical protein [Candidatus Eisenbacteria bacterium]